MVLRNCSITGELCWENALFERKVEIQSCTMTSEARLEGLIGNCFWSLKENKFLGGADFTLAQFRQGLDLSRSSFSAQPKDSTSAGLSLYGAKIGVILLLVRVKVRGKLNCAWLEVNGDCFAYRMRCNAGDVFFKGLKTQGDAFFSDSIFRGSADFSRMSVKGTLDLQNSRFSGLKTTSNANPELVYPNSFFATSVGVDASFEGARFKDNVQFYSFTVQGDTRFGLEPRKSAHFRRTVDFGGAMFNGSFHYTHGIMDGAVNFVKAVFGGNTAFVVRCNSQIAPLRFSGAQFASDTVFSGHYAGGISFFRAQFAGALHFSGSCEIKGTADFRGAKIYSIQFTRVGEEPPPMPFQGAVNMRLCRYQMVQNSDGPQGLTTLWNALRDKWRHEVTGTKEDKFDVQSYEQLETVCRKQRLDELADEVYYESRSIQNRFEKRPVFRIWDHLECWLFGWGVRPLRMIGQFILFWIAGTLVFCLPGTLASVDQSYATPAINERLYSAGVISLSNLVPGLGELKTLGVGPDWLNPCAAICTIVQHLFGWMLVALLAKRFFAGLSRSGDGQEEE